MSNTSNATLIWKWGFDGSGGLENYNQKFEDPTINDSHMFLTTLVPLRLISGNTILWTNPRANSTRNCRVLKFQLKKETTTLINEEKARVEAAISVLEKSKVQIGQREILIGHDLILSMIDGKACNAITGTASAARCSCCKALPKEMNEIDIVMKRPVDPESLKYGISPLHAHIRCLEYMLHIAYRIDIKEWAVSGEKKKHKMNEKKKEIQNRFKMEMGGLLVDKVKHGGGTTNDGNTARRVFQDSEKSSSILGIKENILKRFNIILKVISCGHPLNVAAFYDYCIITAKLITTEYPWYFMPASVHRLLIHGAQIASEAALPLGLLSEEAQEARNKDYKYYRQHHAMKTSRKSTNEDMFRMLFVSSDPIISSKRRKEKKKKQTESAEMKPLLDILEADSSDSETDD